MSDLGHAEEGGGHMQHMLVDEPLEPPKPALLLPPAPPPRSKIRRGSACLR